MYTQPQAQRYWQQRTEARFLAAEEDAIKRAMYMRHIYTQASEFAIKRLQSLISNWYKHGTPPSRSELLQPATKVAIAQYIHELEQFFRKHGGRLTARDKAYIARMTRLQLLLGNLRLAILQTAEPTERITRETLTNIAQASYAATIRDLKAMGFETMQNTIDPQVADFLTNYRWSGKHFSERIWDNTATVANLVAIQVGGGLLAGEPLDRIARRIRDAQNTSMYNAMRLVRTEASFIHNQSEAQALIDEGFTRYRYHATLDHRTSKICRSLHGKVFEFSKMEVGKNAPPMHPNCRSTIDADLNSRVDMPAVGDLARFDPKQVATPKQQARARRKAIRQATVEPVPPKAMKLAKPNIELKVGKANVVLNDFESYVWRDVGLRVRRNGRLRRAAAQLRYSRKAASAYSTDVQHIMQIEIGNEALKNSAEDILFTFRHELGHAIDHWARYVFGADKVKVKDMGNDWVGVVRHRVIRGFEKAGYKGSKLIKVLQNVGEPGLKEVARRYKLPWAYLTSHEEVFADGYAQYRANPAAFKKYAPNMYKLFKKLERKALAGKLKEYKNVRPLGS